MRIARIALSVVGALLIVIGLVWIGQGTGIFPYPPTSFMINQRPWVINGAIVTLAGIVMLFGIRKLFRR
jgi:hypothetical protein